MLLVGLCGAVRAEDVKPANLVANGSFEEGKNGWGTWDADHPELITVDDSLSTDGDKSLKLDGSRARNLFINAHYPVTLKPNTRYLLKADIRRTVVGSGDIYAAVLIWDEKTGQYKFTNYNLPATKGVNVWEHYEIPVITPNWEGPRGHGSEQILVSLYNTMSGGIAWFDNIQLLEAK